MKKLPFFIVVLIATLSACKPGTPSQYIQPDDMEDILVDYHLARAMADDNAGGYEDRNYQQALYVEAVLKKHGVTQEHFDSSLMYYYRRADRFDKICQHVSQRLEAQALVLGASEGEISQYSTLSASGDTANIWMGRTAKVMMPIPPYNRWDFELEIDSTYKPGDSFLMQFMSDFMYQDGSRNGTLYVAVTYDNDSVVARNLHFSMAGLSQLRIASLDGHTVKRLRGFFYLTGNNERSSTIRLLFLNNIQLIRFHNLNHGQEQKDSISSDSITQRAADEIGSRRITGRDSVQLLPADRGTASNRMVRRADIDRVR